MKQDCPEKCRQQRRALGAVKILRLPHLSTTYQLLRSTRKAMGGGLEGSGSAAPEARARVPAAARRSSSASDEH